MLRAFLGALRVEGLTLLRTRETYTFALLPGLVGFPILVFLVVLGSTLTRPPRLAAPLGWPLAPPAAWALVETDDPAAAFDAREADLAVISAAPEGGGWRVEGRWRDVPGRETLRRMLDDAAVARLDAQLVAAGGSVGRDRKVATISGRKGAGRRTSDPAADARVVSGLAALAAVYLGVYVVPVRLAAERASGVLESFAVLRTPLWVILLARLVAVTALGLSTPILAGVSVWLMVGDLLPLPPAVSILEVGAVAAFANAVFLGIGAVSDSSRTALGWASLALLLGGAAAGFGVIHPHPGWPIVGFADPEPVRAAARIALTVAGTAACVAGAARWLRRDGAALPPSGGAA